ncbi:MAG: tail completion protein gp17 [Chloroflexota bacterium]
MAFLTELTGIETWLYTQLANDATMQGLVGNPARVYAGLGPEGAPFPYLVYQYMAGPDVIATGGARVMTRALYTIKAVDKSSSFVTCRTIMNQVETIIENQTGSTADTRILSCIREQPLELVETDSSGTVYRHLGGRFRIQAQAL